MAIVHNDTFTEAADTAITSHTPETGSGYTIAIRTDASIDPGVSAATDILTPCLTYNAPGSTGLLITAGTTLNTAEYDASIVMGTQDTATARKGAGVVARYADTNNFYIGVFYPPAAAADKKIVKRVAGTYTELASGDNGLVAGDVIKFEIRNATKKLYKNSVEVLSTSDNALTAAGLAGIGYGNVSGVGNDEVSSTGNMDISSFTVDESASVMARLPLVITNQSVRRASFY